MKNFYDEYKVQEPFALYGYEESTNSIGTATTITKVSGAAESIV